MSESIDSSDFEWVGENEDTSNTQDTDEEVFYDGWQEDIFGGVTDEEDEDTDWREVSEDEDTDWKEEANQIFDLGYTTEEKIILNIADQFDSHRELSKYLHPDTGEVNLEEFDIGFSTSGVSTEGLFSAHQDLKEQEEIDFSENKDANSSTKTREPEETLILEGYDPKPLPQGKLTTQESLSFTILSLLDYAQHNTEENSNRVENNHLEHVDGSENPDFTVDQYNHILDLTGGDHQKAQNAVMYDGSVGLARKALETEFKLENPVDYITSNSFSEGKSASEAELILSELSYEDRKEAVCELVEEGELFENEYGEVSAAWFQNDTLMVHDTEKGKNRRIDAYDDLNNTLDENKGALTSMLEDVQQEFDQGDYESAIYSSIADDRVHGSIEDQKLEKYLESKI